MSLSRILHPTDFSRASGRAFDHALKLALASRGHLGVVHVDAGGEHSQWSDFPGVRERLIHWGELPEGASKKDVPRLGLSVGKVRLKGATVRALADAAHKDHADFLVMATHARGLLERLLHPSVAEPVARKTQLPALFVPHGASGFVSEEGAVSLQRVLVPVGRSPSPSLAVDAAAGLARALGASPTCRLFFVGSAGDRPEVRTPGGAWEETCAEGPLVDAIVAEVKHFRPDLVVMATLGHDSLSDTLVGSHTEQVLRQVDCPLLAVPAR
ncbi:MAG: universal stress protein [Vulcanimicrobiota bacterium]